MNPLTVTYSPILYTEIGFKNHRAWIDKGGFDNLLFSPNGRVTSILSKEAFINLLHPMQPFKFGIKSLAAKTALKYGINLVMFGEPYAEYGSEDSDTLKKPSYDVNWYINDLIKFSLGYFTTKDFLKKYQWLKFSDIKSFMPLTSDDVKNNKLDVQYLGWYLKWDPKKFIIMHQKIVDICPILKEQMVPTEDIRLLMIKWNGFIIFVTILSLE